MNGEYEALRVHGDNLDSASTSRTRRYLWDSPFSHFGGGLLPRDLKKSMVPDSATCSPWCRLAGTKAEHFSRKILFSHRPLPGSGLPRFTERSAIGVVSVAIAAAPQMKRHESPRIGEHKPIHGGQSPGDPAERSPHSPRSRPRALRASPPTNYRFRQCSTRSNRAHAPTSHSFINRHGAGGLRTIQTNFGFDPERE